MTEIYFSKELNNNFIEQLKEQLKIEFKDCKKIAIKLHFGEPGNKTSLTPNQVKPFTDILKELNIDFFLYDSSVAYDSLRGNPETHKQVAIEKGWDKLGEIKTNDDFILSKGKYMDYEVCEELIKADAVLVISHFKGHICSGFGGAIKNLGMGALTKVSKSKIHTGGTPKIVNNCLKCGACEISCPINSIKITDKPEFSACYGCSDCIIACKHNVLKPKLELFDKLLSDGANTAQNQFKNHYYINLVVNISKECDCESNPKEIIAKDIGYLFGKDAVAIDSASKDLILKQEQCDVFKEKNKKSGSLQLESAEELGMGRIEHKLINI